PRAADIVALDLAASDQLRCQLGGAAILAGTRPQQEQIAAILDDSLRAIAVDLLHLRERLEPDRHTSAELAQSCLCILQPFDPPEGVQFVDMEPDASLERWFER